MILNNITQFYNSLFNQIPNYSDDLQIKSNKEFRDLRYLSIIILKSYSQWKIYIYLFD